MQLDHLVNMFGRYLQQKYNEKIHKLTLHGGFSCPNRDGTLGIGGCTFCNVAAFAEEQMQHQSISQQLTEQASRTQKANRYLAYFQAYTSTYSEVCRLHDMYKEALAHVNIIGLCVGTRPDCVTDAVLDLLMQYQQKGYEIWLELGLQSAHDKTLKRINRGHDFACYQEIVEKAHQHELNVCCHLIVGLPGEGKEHCLQTLDRVVETGVEGIKLHPLHIVEGSIMEKSWRAGRLKELTMDEYVDIAGEIIRHTPKEIIYHRISATSRRPPLLAPLWCEGRWPSMNAIYRNLEEYGGQGRALT